MKKMCPSCEFNHLEEGEAICPECKDEAKLEIRFVVSKLSQPQIDYIQEEIDTHGLEGV